MPTRLTDPTPLRHVGIFHRRTELIKEYEEIHQRVNRDTVLGTEQDLRDLLRIGQIQRELKQLDKQERS